MQAEVARVLASVETASPELLKVVRKRFQELDWDSKGNLQAPVRRRKILKCKHWGTIRMTDSDERALPCRRHKHNNE